MSIKLYDKFVSQLELKGYVKRKPELSACLSACGGTPRRLESALRVSSNPYFVIATTKVGDLSLSSRVPHSGACVYCADRGTQAPEYGKPVLQGLIKKLNKSGKNLTLPSSPPLIVSNMINL